MPIKRNKQKICITTYIEMRFICDLLIKQVKKADKKEVIYRIAFKLKPDGHF